MKVKKRLGIWMDHATACWMEYAVDTFKANTINAKHVSMINQQPLLQSESALHNKEKQSLQSYYKSLMEIIRDYDEAIIYGPSSAKTELYNLIRADHRFDAIKIETKSASKMGYKEQHAFLVKYFSKLLNYDSTYSK
jgi:stalled ribosome rescue protein Dom34